MHAKLNRPLCPWLFAALVAASLPAEAAKIITGQVNDDGGGVAGVAISAEWRGSGRRALSEQTDPSGNFRVEIADSELGESKTLTLFFEKAGYRSEPRLILINSEGKPVPPELKVTLSSSSEPASADDFAPLAQEKSHEGRTIFFIPYGLHTAKSDEDSALLNHNLPDDIKYGIATRLSSLYPKAISIQPINPGIVAANTEKIRRLGSYLNALAVVTGRGAIRSDATGGQVVDVMSEFVLPADAGDILPSDTFVEDLIPVSELPNPHLGETLNEAWAHRTLLALANKELRNREADPAAIVRYLNAAKLSAATEAERGEIEAMIAIARRVQP